MELEDDSESQKHIITQTNEVSVSIEDSGEFERNATTGSVRR